VGAAASPAPRILAQDHRLYRQRLHGRSPARKGADEADARIGLRLFRDKGITVVTLGALHRNWIGSSAWYKLGFEAWNEERRMVLKPRPK
jgi:hypothetical protein